MEARPLNWTLKKEKVDVFFVTISIAILVVQLLKNCRNVFETQSNIYNGACLQKSSVADVWLGSKYASQSTFNGTTFIPELIFIKAFQNISI